MASVQSFGGGRYGACGRPWPRAAPSAEPASRLIRDEQSVGARRSRGVHRGALVVLVVGALVTLALSFGAGALNSRNEDRLLHQRAREVGLVAASSTSTTQTPLSSAASVAAATNGDVDAFRTVIGPLAGPGKRFGSASLWSLDATPPRVIAVVGTQPSLASETPSAISEFFAKAGPTTLAVNDELGTARRLGYGITASGVRPRYAVYTETELPKNRKANIAKDSAFSDLGYALYIGAKPIDAQLLASSTGHGISGRSASTTVPFGNSSILIVINADKQLGGSLLLWLPWILAALGVVLVASSTLLAEHLIRRREGAESLAGALDLVARENERLYNEQRSVARTLQHTLLPARCPTSGSNSPARYVAGEADVEIGGDWYDVVRLPDARVLFVIGDVSGRGIPAATVMASLRFAVRAFASLGDAPDAILTNLAGLLSIKDDGHFATVLCCRIDLAARHLEVANAGHPAPLMISSGGASYVPTRIGVPIGATSAPHYDVVEADLPAAGTLLLYTDGLVERRGENLDVGLARLADSVADAGDASVEDLLRRVVRDLIPDGASDDTALLGLRWKP